MNLMKHTTLTFVALLLAPVAALGASDGSLDHDGPPDAALRPMPQLDAPFVEPQPRSGLPLYVDEAGDQMTGNLGFPSSGGPAWGGGILTWASASGLTFNGAPVCLGDTCRGKDFVGGPVQSFTVPAACTNFYAVTWTVPRAGRMVAFLDAQTSITHILGVTDRIVLNIGDSATDCSGAPANTALHQVPSQLPSGAYVEDIDTSRARSVSAGTNTFYVNGLGGNGGDTIVDSLLRGIYLPG